MSLPVKTGLPEGLDLGGGYTIRWTAVDPTTGVVNTSVVISAASVLAADTTSGAGELTFGPFMLVAGPDA